MDKMRKPEMETEGLAVLKRKWRLLLQKSFLVAAITLLVVLCLPLAPPEQPVTSRVLSADGEIISLLYRENRELAALAEIPTFLQQAFLAVEDHRFYQHNGFSPVSFGRAVYHNLFVREGLQGFSTITQQVAKNCYLSAERTLIRKVKELFSLKAGVALLKRGDPGVISEPDLLRPRCFWRQNRGPYLFWAAALRVKPGGVSHARRTPKRPRTLFALS